jgi:hypothetical protein
MSHGLLQFITRMSLDDRMISRNGQQQYSKAPRGFLFHTWRPRLQCFLKESQAASRKEIVCAQLDKSC